MSIVLHHLADLSVAQVAEETGASVSAVKQQLVRGRAALAGLLEEDPPAQAPEPALLHRTEGSVMDALTELLHEAAEALPDSVPAADRVRHSAEHARRTHRVVAGAAAAALLAVTAFGVGVLGGGGRSELAPAVPASRVWAPPVGSVFTADPVMPKAGWVAIGPWRMGPAALPRRAAGAHLGRRQGNRHDGGHAATLGLHHGPVHPGR